MRKPNHTRRNAIIVILLLMMAGTIFYFLIARTKMDLSSRKEGVRAQVSSEQVFRDASFEQNGKWYGLCKKNSVHSIEDFRNTVANDRVLNAHYADFNWNNARMGKLQKATWAYVYYRKNETIFRKQKPILLPAGDPYITDGTVKARITCCNRYAPTAPPSEPDLDANPSAGPGPSRNEDPGMPPEPVQDPSHVNNAGAPSTSSEASPNIAAPLPLLSAGPFPVVYHYPEETTTSSNPEPGTDPVNPPPVPVPVPRPEPKPEPKPIPEASTLFLLGIGVAFLYSMLFAFRKAHIRK